MNEKKIPFKLQISGVTCKIQSIKSVSQLNGETRHVIIKHYYFMKMEYVQSHVCG
jgi:hypothetical protein